MTPTLYGITNCDTVRKARRWLDGEGLDYRFHDLRRDGINEAEVRRWCASAGWERVLNRAGTTFRALAEAERLSLDEDRAVAILLAHPATVKRPVLALDRGRILVGFDPARYGEAFAGS